MWGRSGRAREKLGKKVLSGKISVWSHKLYHRIWATQRQGGWAMIWLHQWVTAQGHPHVGMMRGRLGGGESCISRLSTHSSQEQLQQRNQVWAIRSQHPQQLGEGCPNEVKDIWVGHSQYPLHFLIVFHGVGENVQTANDLKLAALKQVYGPENTDFGDYMIPLKLFAKCPYIRKWQERRIWVSSDSL